mmetsp:Transcript_65359/g.105908  ORF Transcript_65359/g.105908 Transcript_65359/m.105908 type:complete len:103 (-) Transcript_65359:26-334(-)
MAMIPVIPSFFVFLPATAQLWLEGFPGVALLHLSLQFSLWLFVPTKIYKEIEALIPPYFTGLSVFAGIWVFGLCGVVYGPVLMNVVPVIYRALKYRVLLTDS